jgi:hypothetical protein
MPAGYDTNDPVDEMVSAKYESVDVTINGADCRIWYDPEKHDICLNKKGLMIKKLVDKIR